VHVGKRLLLELSERAGVLVGLALLLGGVVISALLFDRDACLVHALALGGVGGGLLARAPRLGGIRVVVVGQVAFGQCLPISGIARIALGGGLPVRGAFGGIGIARRQQREWLVEFGIDAGGAQQACVALALSGSSLANSM